MPAIVTATELGCVPADATFDNALKIQPALDSGLVVLLDMPREYYTAPLKFPQGMGGCLRGAWGGYRGNPAGRTILRKFLPAQTHLIEMPGGASGGVGKLAAIEDIGFLGDSTLDAVRIYSGESPSVRRCSFQNFRKGIEGIYKSRLISPLVEDCFFSNCDNAIWFQSGTTCSSLQIRGGSIDRGKTGVYVVGWGTRGISITGLAIQGSSEAGIYLRDSNAVLTGCYIEPSDAPDGLPQPPGIKAFKGSIVACHGVSCTRIMADSASKIIPDAASALGYSLQAV